MSEKRDNSLEHQRERVLLAALPHVPFDGWSRAAMAAGVADAGLDESTALRAFPAGAPELVEYFSTYTDQRMTAVLEKTDLAGMRVRDRVTTGVKVRLDLLARHREAVRRACSYLALPQNVALGLRCLYRTVDAVWRAAGDTSTDFNFYTKRALLAGVYSSTLLYWLNDESEDFEDTAAFLDRRIADVMEFEKARGRVKKFLTPSSNPLRRSRTRAPGGP
ncbi:MAG: COQ9 family protein [Alphaproteobacteria bacterium]